MEIVRDIVIIMFSITGTIASVVLIIMGFKFYGRACEALDRVGRASDDIHEVVEGARSGVRLAKGVSEVVALAVPGPGWFRAACRTAAAVPRAAKAISRLKSPLKRPSA